MILDNKLIWKSHIMELKSACLKKLKLLKKLSNSQYGSDRSSLQKIYQMLSRSKMDLVL